MAILRLPDCVPLASPVFSNADRHWRASGTLEFRQHANGVPMPVFSPRQYLPAWSEHRNRRFPVAHEWNRMLTSPLHNACIVHRFAQRNNIRFVIQIRTPRSSTAARGATASTSLIRSSADQRLSRTVRLSRCPRQERRPVPWKNSGRRPDASPKACRIG